MLKSVNHKFTDCCTDLDSNFGLLEWVERAEKVYDFLNASLLVYDCLKVALGDYKVNCHFAIGVTRHENGMAVA